MLIIEDRGAYKNKITLTRGDTAILKLSLKDAFDKDVALLPDDKVLLTIKKTPDDNKVILQIVMNNNQFEIVPEDTRNLPYGTYYYDVQVNMANGDVYTVIPPAHFVVDKEVTW